MKKKKKLADLSEAELAERKERVRRNRQLGAFKRSVRAQIENDGIMVVKARVEYLKQQPKAVVRAKYVTREEAIEMYEGVLSDFNWGGQFKPVTYAP